MSKKYKKFLNQPVVILKLNHNIEMFRGIFEEASELGWRILDLNVTRSSIPSETNAIGILTVGFPGNETILSLKKKECPTIRIGTLPEPEKDTIIPAVIPDINAAGQMAADHFADRQFKNVAFVGNFPWAERPILFNSFEKRALERGCKTHLLQVKNPPGISGKQKIYDERVKQIKEWLEKLPKPIGIFTYNDISAATIYTTTRKAGFNVPEEVALLGYGNSTIICDFLPVPLSSVDINNEEIGRSAIKLLNKLLEGEKAPTEALKVPLKGVVTRQSTNLLAVSDLLVARALRFIWENFTEQISIDDIASVTGVARCTIINKFKKCLGHSINYEINKRRLKQACELLRNSRFTVADVAELSGFASPTYFHYSFRKFYGITPTEFRKRHAESVSS